MINFINSHYFYIALLLVLFVIGLAIYSERKRKKIFTSLLASENASKLISSACNLRRFWRNVFFLLATIILGFCVLRPFNGVETEEYQVQVRNILVLFDVSKSMNVIDCYGESRLNYGRSLVRDVTKDFPSEKYGLMSFAGLGIVEIPLTTDQVSFQIALDELKKYKNPLGGSNLQMAIDQAIKEFKEDDQHKSIILISDGEEMGGDYREAAELLKKNKVKLITVLTGDERKAGTVRDMNGTPSRNAHGEVITSKADPKTLRELAKISNGEFIEFNPEGNRYQQINQLKSAVKNIAAKEGEKEVISKPREIYQPFLFVAILLLLLRMFFGERKNSFATVSAILFISMQISPLQGQNSGLSPQQEHKLKQLKSVEATLRENINSSVNEPDSLALSWYNLATNLSQQHLLNPVEPTKENGENKEPNQPKEEGTFAKALAAFEQALSLSEKQKLLKANILHNKGTLLQKEGQKNLLKDPDLAETHLKNALEMYRQSLTLLPGDQQIRQNLERSYIDISQVSVAKEIHQLRNEAKIQAGKALQTFRKLGEDPKRIDEKKQTILKSTQIVKEKCNIIKQKLAQIEQQEVIPLFEKVIDHINQSENTLPENTKKDETEHNLAEAYKLLGGNPDNNQENSNENNQDQEKNNKQDPQDQEQNPQDPKNQQQNQNQEKNNQQDSQDPKNQQQNNANDKSDPKDSKLDKNNQNPQNGFFDKDEKQPPLTPEQAAQKAKMLETESLLRKLNEKEQEVREHLREIQAEMYKEELRRQGIQVPPEADK